MLYCLVFFPFHLYEHGAFFSIDFQDAIPFQSLVYFEASLFFQFIVRSLFIFSWFFVRGSDFVGELWTFGTALCCTEMQRAWASNSWLRPGPCFDLALIVFQSFHWSFSFRYCWLDHSRSPFMLVGRMLVNVSAARILAGMTMAWSTPAALCSIIPFLSGVFILFI